MSKKESQLNELTATLRVVEKSGTPEFVRELITFLNIFLSVDHCVVVTYLKGQGLKTLFTEGVVPKQKAQNLAQKYESEYLRDPNFRKLLNPHAQGERTIPFPRDEVSDEDYIEFFYTNAGIADKVSTVASIGKTRILSSFYRISPSPKYDKQALAILNDILPVATGLVVNHYRLLNAVVTEDKPRQKLAGASQVIHTVISQETPPFNQLSQRERDICERTLLGNTAAEISREMGIAQSTVVTHRKRAYNKLRIASHKDLFTLFLESSDKAL